MLGRGPAAVAAVGMLVVILGLAGAGPAALATPTEAAPAVTPVLPTATTPTAPGTPPTGLSPTSTPTPHAGGGATATPSGTPSPTEPPSDQDLAFLRQAHEDNLAEIRAGTSAEHRGTSNAARNLGARFVREHVSLDADLQRVAARLGVSMPTTLTPERQRQLDEINARTGTDFDRAWVDMVTAWNTQALADTQTELRAGSLSDIRDLARDSLGVIRGHLSRLQKVPTAGPQVPTPVRLNNDDYADSQSPLVVSVAMAMIALGLAMIALTARAALRAHFSRR